MATYTNRLLVNDSTNPVKRIEASDELVVSGQFTSDSPIRVGRYDTGSLPSASGRSGAFVYDTTVNQPKWSNGTAWQTFGGGSGTVTNVSLSLTDGIEGSVANATTTPEISLNLGNINLSDPAPSDILFSWELNEVLSPGV